MRAIIIEDERQAINALKQEINDSCPSLTVCGEASTIKEAGELIEREQPDIVFLDIQLKDGTGFDLLEGLESYDFKVIFTTAYGQYALQALKISALDYLLKPIDGDQLKSAVDKAKSLDLKTMNAQLQNLIHNQRLDPLRRKIALPSAHGITLYETREIMRIQSDGNYSKIYLSGGKTILVAKTLKEFEITLDALGFLRIHHSHIINLEHLESYITKEGGYVVMRNQQTVPVSKRKRNELLKALQTKL